MITRKYKEYESLKKVAGIIAAEVIEKNISTGWSGSYIEENGSTVEEVEILKNILKRYNIIYVDDIHGEWALKM